MIPGPTPLRDEVRAALAEPVRSHTSVENAATVRRVQRGIRECIGSAAARVHVFAGSGTLAMEVALVNHAAPGQRIVVVSHGYFGDRFIEIGRALGMQVDVVAAPWGEHIDPAELRRVIFEGDAPAVVTLTHVDTSTGVLADVAALAAPARAAGAIVVVDGVCATGGVEERFDEWGIDVLLTGAQKALGVPPGLAIVAVGERATARRTELGRIAAYYADLRRWDPVVDDPTKYFSTHATSLLRALEVSLDAIEAEGLPQCFARHATNADALREGMSELGFRPLTAPAVLAPTLSVLGLPDGVDDAALRSAVAAEGVIVAGCLGPFAGRGIRVAHMGAVGQPEVLRTLDAVRSALTRASHISA